MDAIRQSECPFFTIFKMEHETSQRRSLLLPVARAVEQMDARELLMDGNAFDLRRQEFAVAGRVQACDLQLSANGKRRASQNLRALRKFRRNFHRLRQGCIVEARKIQRLKG